MLRHMTGEVITYEIGQVTPVGGGRYLPAGMRRNSTTPAWPGGGGFGGEGSSPYEMSVP